MSPNYPQSTATAPDIGADFTQHARTLHRDQTGRALGSVVPACSRSCLETFISSNFRLSACSRGEDDLECLCAQKSTSGFTLEEGALQCLLSSCAAVSQPDLRVYTICSTVEDALPNTHTSLAVTVKTPPVFVLPSTTEPSPTPRSTGTSSTTIPTSVSTSVSTSSSLRPSPTETFIPSSRSEMSNTSTSTPTVVVGTGPPSASSQPSNAPSRVQVIGLAVGGAILGVTIMALIIFFVRRKRKESQDFESQRDDFEIGGDMSEPPFPNGPRMFPVPETPIGAYNQPIADKLGSLPNNQIQPGSSVSPKLYPIEETYSMGARGSPSSQTSMTWLLPKNADYATNEGQQPTHVRHSSATIFEEDWADHQPRSSSEPFVFGGGNGFHTSNSANQDANNYISLEAPANTSARNSADRSPSDDEWNRSHNRAALHSVSPPPTSSSRYSGTSNAAPPTITRQNNYHEYTQPPAVRSTSGNYSNPPKSRSRGDSLNPQTHPQRTSSQHSTSSATSFESNGSSDVDIYRVPQRSTIQLSPVQEAASPPLQQSPNRARRSRESPNLQVPEPAYQARGRQGPVNYSRPSLSRESPLSQTSSHSSRLLTDRRGDRFANKMEKGLGFTSGTPIIMPIGSNAASASYSRESSRSRSRSGSTSRPPRKSHWERRIFQHGDSQAQATETPITPSSWKLTPTRTGKDLVLRIN